MKHENRSVNFRLDALVARFIRRVGCSLSSRASNRLMQLQLRDAGVPRAKHIFSYTSPGELDALYQLAASCPQGAAALEIGSHLGASTCYLGAGIRQRDGTLFCVDTWNNATMPEGEKDTFAIFRANTVGLGGTIVPIRKWSTEVKKNDIRTPLDLVFIDGDHSYQAVKADFEIIRPWLSPRAVVAFHDTVAFKGVSRLLGEVLALGDYEIAGHVQNLSWIRRASR